MGCGSSSAKSGGIVNGSIHKKVTRQSKSEEVSVSDDDLTMANETLRMRQERDQQVFKEIQAEKAALRAIASVIIEQRSSCENLLDLLEATELEDLKENPNSHQLQKAATVKVAKSQKDKKRRWVMYNNVGAIDSHSIEKLAEFMNYSIIGACDSEHLDHNDGDDEEVDHNLAFNTASNATAADDFMPPALTVVIPTNLERNEFAASRRDSRRLSISKDLRNVTDRHETYEYGSSPTSSPQRAVRRKSLKVSTPSGKYVAPTESEEIAATIVIPNTKGGANVSRALPTTPSTPAGQYPAPPTSVKRATSTTVPAVPVEEVDPDLKRQLLSMNILTVTPQSAFRIGDNNIFDYDFPPGLVTIGVAAAVIELFKRGGRLTPKSVHKLLRLGYRSFKARPNTNKINLGPTDRLTVVGDIHGQLSDLLHIVDSVGLPSRSNRYLFNGDFVDRGAYGVEVMCVLLVLHAAMPEYVTLNRGNHEDYAICTAYGFQVECFEKYGELIFGMFVEVFQQIPLFTIINDSVFVLHGGLFHTRDALLSELNAIKRTTFSLEDLPEGGEGITEVPRFKRKEYLKQLVRDALWSDPVDKTGTHPSIRGAGVGFGPDVTRIFLNTNKLKFVVRSHECVRSGYNEPYTGENQPLLCTIFSASDYGSSGNSAAYMVFKVTDPSAPAATTTSETVAVTTPPHDTNSRSPSVSSYTAGEEEACSVSEIKHVRNCNLSYTVHYFYIDAEFRDGERINNLHKNDVHLNTGGRVFSREVYNAQYGGGGFGFGPSSSQDALTALNVPPTVGEETQYVITDEYDSGKQPRGAIRAAQLSCRSAHDTVLVGLSISLYELILEKKYALQEVFSVLDPKGEGVVTKSQFSMVLHDVLRVPVQWIRLIQVLLEEHHFKMHHGKRLIDYAAFLNQFLELTTVPKGDVEAEDEDPNLDALGRYLKAMEKTASSLSAAKETKKQEETVKAIRTSSASAIDVSHHLRNISQFDKFSALPTAGSKTKDDLGKPFVPSQTVSRELKPLEAPKPPVYVSAGNRGRTASGSLEPASLSSKHQPPVIPPFNDEKKEGDVAADLDNEEEEGNSYHNYLVTEGLLDVLYTDFIRLEQTFQFFDRDKKGHFTQNDLTRGFEELSRVMPPGALLPSAEEVMHMLDVHASGEVDMNLFFEMHRICDLSLKAHIDDDDSVDETSRPNDANGLSRDQSMDNLARRMSIGGTAMLNAQQMQVLQQAQLSPNSPTHHHATGVRNDSNASLAIKGVNINVDELTTVNTVSNVESRAESRKIAAAAAVGLDI